MIIKGKSRGGAASLTRHLERVDTNEVAELWELRGVAATDLDGALAEMEAVASGARTQKGLYHAAINPRDNEVLSEAQKLRAVDALEKELGFEGQPRAVMQHVKEGRAHLHVVWSRIDLDRMAAISDSHNYRKHETVARELEREFGHERTQGAHVERDDQERPARTPSHAEMQQEDRTGISPKEMKAELSRLWNETETGQQFAAGIEERGYLLARGDRRDFVVLDQAGETHSLARRIDGAKAADVRERMSDVDRAMLPNVEEARALQFDRAAERHAQAELAPPEPAPAPAPEIEMPAAPEPSPTFEPTPELDVGRESEKTLMVASDIAGKGAERLSDFVTGLVDSMVAPPQPKREYSALEMATDPAARRAQYAREGAERLSNDALERTREHMEAGRALRPEDIRALTPDHLINIKAKGDDYLRDMVTARQKEMDTLSRDLERD